MMTVIETGLGYSLEPVEYSGDEPVRIVAYIERHPRPDNEVPCEGMVWIDQTSKAYHSGSPVWTVVSPDPLTLSPSILCRACGRHGYVRDGLWVPA